MKVYKTHAIEGEGRGRKIGFPTINLDFKDLKLDYGVYLVDVLIDLNKYQGLAHFGPKKTFTNLVSLELFLKENIDNIFNKKIELRFFKKIREIIEFPNTEELKKQIKKDLKYL